jgi:hypothetical protein
MGGGADAQFQISDLKFEIGKNAECKIEDAALAQLEVSDFPRLAEKTRVFRGIYRL